MEFIADNFGLLEWILFIELVVLATATFFYQAAKIISRRDRHDPMVRFYYIFWQAFWSDVTPVGVMISREAEIRARAAGIVMAGDLTPEQLNEMDAPDLGAIGQDDWVGRTLETPLPPAETPGKRKTAAPETPVADGTLDVRITGRSPADVVTGHTGKTLLINVRAEVEDGQANGVVVQLVSEAIGVPVHRIVLLRGHYKADKAFKILGVDQASLDRRVMAVN